MEIDFKQFKVLQYWDNNDCYFYKQIGSGNIFTLSQKIIKFTAMVVRIVGS